MPWELLRVLLNPTVVVALLFMWVGTSVYQEVTQWVRERQIVRPYVKALIQRDAAIKFKDELIDAVAKDKEAKDVELDELREQLEVADRNRPKPAAGVPDCTWSDYDIRVLNGRARRPRS
jgi:hypothetical protein